MGQSEAGDRSAAFEFSPPLFVSLAPFTSQESWDVSTRYVKSPYRKFISKLSSHYDHYPAPSFMPASQALVLFGNIY